MVNISQKNNVLMVLENGFPMEKGGGAEAQLNTLGTHMSSLCWGVEIVAPMVSYAPQVSNELVNGIPVHRIKYPKIRIFGGVFMLIYLALYLVKHRASYDVIHVHIASNMAAVCSLIGALINKPVLVKLTGMTEIKNGILDNKISLRIKLLKWAIKKASYYQATSQQIASLLYERGFDKDKINLIPNAVDTDRFNSDHKITIPNELKADKIGIFVGRLVKEKNLELFFTAFNNLFTDKDSVSLFFIGHGYLRQSLEDYVKKLDVKNKIHFMGPKTDVENYISMAHFGILPSFYEGLSNTLLEYMSSAIPVLGSRVSGTEDFIEHGKNGWLFDSENLTELTEYLNVIKNTSNETLLEMGNAGRKYIVDYAGISSVTNRIMKLYFKKC